jgi:hypothetical protein
MPCSDLLSQGEAAGPKGGDPEREARTSGFEVRGRPRAISQGAQSLLVQELCGLCEQDQANSSPLCSVRAGTHRPGSTQPDKNRRGVFRSRQI